jgi:hypothetical protein
MLPVRYARSKKGRKCIQEAAFLPLLDDPKMILASNFGKKTDNP